jgi:hypothetical protein
VIDPLWVLVLAAGMLAGVALAQPRWVRGNLPPRLAVTWAVRSTRGTGGVTEAWVRCPDATNATVLLVNGTARSVNSSDLHNGLALPLTAGPGGRVMLELRSGGALAKETFTNPGVPPFGLLEIAASGAGIDPALRRVFTVQANVRAGDPTVQPRVLLVNDPKVRAEDLEGADLVIAQPATPLPGITAGATVEGQWMPRVESGSGIAWPAFVSLKDVHVRRMCEAVVSGDWRVIATADGKPWIAVREIPRVGAGKVMWVWLASSPLTDTDWVKDPGFVLFFAEMQQRELGGEAAAISDWTRLPEADNSDAAGAVELVPYVGVAGIALLVGAMVWFVRRAR